VAKWLVVKLDNTHSSGETRLMRCLGAGDRTIASSLALNLIKAGVFVNSQSNEGLTALMLATERHEVAIIRALLDAKANLEDQNVDGDTALILAARKGWSDTISILLNAKANVNVWNRRGELPLHLACAHGDSAGIQALLNAKAKPEIFCCGRTALCWALISQQGANMITLLNGKAAVNTLPPGGYTVTDLASQNGLTDVIKLFRQYGGKTRDELERT
jgi:ankyrin repeat protein